MTHLKKTAGPPSPSWSRIPPWIFIGAVAVLLPILALITASNINRQKENSQQLLIEKGAALIRSFEAGTRFGMMGMMGGRFQLQRLLEETAGQPGIVYLLVADADGTAVAHSDPSRIGRRAIDAVLLSAVFADGRLHWQKAADDGGKPVFEVIRRFRPAPRRRTMGHGRFRHFHEAKAGSRENGGRQPETDRAIVVGLDMAQAEAARRADMRHSIFMAFILLLVGLAGIVLLFMTQQYRAARKSLSRIRAFSDQLVDNMPVGLVSLDQQGRLAAVNPAARQILELPPSLRLGAVAENILPPDLARVLHGLDANHSRAEAEIDCAMANGRNVPLGISASFWHDESGTEVGHILMIRDLTEVHALRREIARSQRLASIGSLAAGVAHEIRNPLSSIKGFATYFQERYRDVEADRETAAIMIEEVDRLNRVVGQLLELSRPVEIARQPVRLEDLIARSLALVESRAREAGIEIKTMIPSPPPRARLDADRMQQVLLNLYLNAMDAMDGGGTLAVAIRARKDGRLAIEVADTGQGMDDQQQQRIFDPYFTTKSSGTGLGLAIVHNIMEAHNGSISVDSRPGTGTTVRCMLPANEEVDGE